MEISTNDFNNIFGRKWIFAGNKWHLLTLLLFSARYYNKRGENGVSIAFAGDLFQFKIRNWAEMEVFGNDVDKKSVGGIIVLIN